MREATIVVLGSGRRATRATRRLTAAGIGTVVRVEMPPSRVSVPLAADIVVVATSGQAARIGAAVGRELSRSAKHSRDSVVIVASSPTDLWCEAVWRASALPASRILGVAGGAYPARLRRGLAAAAGVPPSDVEVPVVSSGRAVRPLVDRLTVAGVPATRALPPERLTAVLAAAAQGGTEQQEDAATSLVELVEAVAGDRGRLVSCCVRLEGSYELHDVWLGVPAVVGRGGVAEIPELPLDDGERRRLRRWAAGCRRRLAGLGEGAGPEEERSRAPR